VLDKTTGKVEITSQKHGFIVDASTLPSGVHVTHENLFDHSNEGIAVAGKPIFSVQYHPEASPGPHDSSYLFARFRDLLAKGGDVERSPAALLDQVIEELYARHHRRCRGRLAGAPRVRGAPRQGPSGGRAVEPWSAAFVEWFVIERVVPGHVPPAALTSRELASDDHAGRDARARDVAAQPVRGPRAGSGRGREKGRGREQIELLDLLAAPCSTSTSSARCTAWRSATSRSFG